MALTLYQASAGSGKTFTLVVEYLSIVLRRPENYRHVLAVTFTNKATAEMKARIVDTLMALVRDFDGKKAQSYAQALAARGLPPDWVRQHAPRLLTLLLLDYGNFSVSTIEKFFQRVVRALAYELNVNLAYDIEMEQEVVLKQLTQTLLDESLTNEALFDLLVDYQFRQLDDEKSLNIEQSIVELGRELFRETLQQYQQHWGEEATSDRETSHAADGLALAKTLETGIRDVEAAISAFSQQIENQLKTHGLDITDFNYGKAGGVGWMLKFSRSPFPAKDMEPTKRFWELLEKGNGEDWIAGSQKKDTGKKNRISLAVDSPGGIRQLAEQLADAVQRLKPTYILYKALYNKVFAFGVLRDLLRLLRAYRHEHNILFISDTANLLNRLIGQREDAPFVYEKMGNRYQHYLIDEFQDTSDMQWHNLLPLLTEAMSQSAVNSTETNKSLVVGDVKQSIYRWRNGNLYLLLRQVEQDMAQVSIPASREALRQNWRTAPEIVTFNNAFFAQAVKVLDGRVGLLDDDNDDEPAANPDSGIIQQAYADVAQEPKRTDTQGYLRVELWEDLEKAEDFREKALERLPELVAEAEAAGFRPGDIAVLVRTNGEARRVVERLIEVKKPVVSNEALLAIAHPQVQTAEAALAFLLDPGNDIAREALIRALGDTDRGPGTMLAKVLIQQRMPLLQKPLYECIVTVVASYLGYQEPHPYLLCFLDEALRYSEQGDGSLAAFMGWWEARREKASVALPESGDAIQVLTVHKSKGLEYPVVILPMANWSFQQPGSGSTMWPEIPGLAPDAFGERMPVAFTDLGKLDRQPFKGMYDREATDIILDNLNLLYVALTRPRERLYVLAQLVPTQNKKGEDLKIKSIAHLLAAVLRRPSDAWQESHAPGRFVFEAGTPALFTSQQTDSKIDKLTLQPVYHPRWENAVKIRTRAGLWNNANAAADRQERILTGEVLHQALASVVHTADIPAAVDRALHAGLILPDDTAPFRELLTRVCTHADVADWFSNPSWEVRNECEILLPSATGKPTTLRPDRVMIRQQEVVVLDYKTGKPAASHEAQVQSYIHAIEALGYTHVSGYLYYTGINLLKNV